MRVLYLSDRETLTSLPQEVLEMVVNKLHVDEKVYSFACACAFMHCIGAINCKSQYFEGARLYRISWRCAAKPCCPF